MFAFSKIEIEFNSFIFARGNGATVSKASGRLKVSFGATICFLDWRGCSRCNLQLFKIDIRRFSLRNYSGDFSVRIEIRIRIRAEIRLVSILGIATIGRIINRFKVCTFCILNDFIPASLASGRGNFTSKIFNVSIQFSF